MVTANPEPGYKRTSLPEFRRYVDDGCKGCHGPVLDCPFEVCTEDREDMQRLEAERQLAKVLDLRKTKSVSEVARALGLSRRSIFRILKRGRLTSR